MKYSLDPGAYPPSRAHAEDAGLDLRTPVGALLPAGGSISIDTGVHVEIPFGYGGLIVSKSGLNVRHDITATGLIDCGYTGSIVVKLYNHGTQDYQFAPGDKITQLVILPVLAPELEPVDSLENTSRGDKGFGSTGK